MACFTPYALVTGVGEGHTSTTVARIQLTCPPGYIICSQAMEQLIPDGGSEVDARSSGITSAHSSPGPGLACRDASAWTMMLSGTGARRGNILESCNVESAEWTADAAWKHCAWDSMSISAKRGGGANPGSGFDGRIATPDTVRIIDVYSI